MCACLVRTPLEPVVWLLGTGRTRRVLYRTTKAMPFQRLLLSVFLVTSNRHRQNIWQIVPPPTLRPFRTPRVLSTPQPDWTEEYVESLFSSIGKELPGRYPGNSSHYRPLARAARCGGRQLTHARCGVLYPPVGTSQALVCGAFVRCCCGIEVCRAVSRVGCNSHAC